MLTTNMKFYSGLVTVPVSYCQHHYGLRPSKGLHGWLVRLPFGGLVVWWFGFFSFRSFGQAGYALAIRVVFSLGFGGYAVQILTLM